jgi:hypothetical protein
LKFEKVQVKVLVTVEKVQVEIEKVQVKVQESCFQGFLHLSKIRIAKAKYF